MKVRKKNKRKSPKRTRAKTRGKTNADLSSTENFLGSLLATVSPSDLLSGLSREHNLMGPNPEDVERIQREKQIEEAIDEAIDERVSKLRESNARPMSELRRLGVDEKRLVVHLWATWLACHEQTRKLFEVPGVSFRKIKKLPDLLRKLANNVEAINKYNLPSYGLYSSRQSRYTCKSLPDSLRLYANELSTRLRKRRSRGTTPGTGSKVQTVEFVRTASTDGRQHYDVVASLMNAFNKLEDEKECGRSTTVTADSLKQLWLADARRLKKPAQLPKPPAVGYLGQITLTAPGKLN